MFKKSAIVIACAIFLASCDVKSHEQRIADAIQEGASSCKAAGGFYGSTPDNFWAGDCYANKYGYCAKTCRLIFEDLNDTVGSTQNLSDTISTSINKCMDDCNSKN